MSKRFISFYYSEIIIFFFLKKNAFKETFKGVIFILEHILNKKSFLESYFSFYISNFCNFHCVSPRLSENNEIYALDTIRLIYNFVIDSCNDLRINLNNFFQSSAPSLIILFFTEFIRLSEHVQFVKF